MRKPASNPQLPLELAHEPSLSRDDLLEGQANRQAIKLLDDWPNWPSQFAVLMGPVGSGKTHIASVWADEACAETVDASDLEAGALLAAHGPLLIEDLAIGLDETGLFHVLNTAMQHKHSVLMTSRSFPGAWQLTIPDLISRLRLAHLVELQEPDDALLSSLIVKLFADRQLEISPAVLRYLISRIERSMASAARVVAMLDRAALSQNRKITRALAAQVLSQLDQDADQPG